VHPGRSITLPFVNGLEAAAAGGFVGALIMSVLAVLLDRQRARRTADERQKERAHDLQMRTIEQRHEMQLAAMQDAVRLRDARFSRLNDDARQLARALFDLERLALLMQWGRQEDSDELERLEMSARAHFESARAGLTLDPEGARLTGTFESVTREIAQYQSMIKSHRVLVDARAVEQVITHADQMQAQRAKVVEGIMVAVSETQSMLKSVATPVEAPEAPEPAGRPASTGPAVPQVTPKMDLIPRPR
jgi:hypothetical protein